PHARSALKVSAMTPLEEYRAKRDFEHTPEPGGEASEPADDASAAVRSAQEQMSETTNRVVLLVVLLALLAIAVAVAAAVILARTVTSALRSVILKLTSSASELSSVSAQVSASSVETGASIVETTTTVREVKQSALVATERAAEIRQATDETSRIAEMGTRSVDETIAGIENMGEQMAVVTESIVRLSDQTSAISDVIATVKDLAEQSNLLSVNAAIEAARAGEQGKGFTVVAQEVKNLADQSKQAVSQVRDILADIQRATTSAVLATELGSKAIERGAVQSRDSGSSIEQLAENVVEAVTMMRQTAVASEQQLAGMDQISAAMEAISEASNQNIAGSRQVEDEVHHVLDVARDLERLIDNKTSMAAS
ncbi:MAG: methyl-accepting chemotaxis protein, partial [Actinomycetes bacterium]